MKLSAIAATSLAFALCGASAAAQGTSPPIAAPSKLFVPGVTAYREMVYPNPDGAAFAEIVRDMDAKLIRFEASIGSGFSTDFFDENVARCSFHPTATALADPTTFYVAGYTSRGFNVIEKWTLSGPPLVQQSVVGGQTQITGVSATTVTLRESLYIGNDPDMDVVQGLSVGWGGDLAILFNSKRSVYTLDTSDPIALPVLKATELAATAPVLNTSGITGHVENLTVRHHSVLGEVLSLRRHTSPGFSEAIVLIDGDRDGYFDQDLVLDGPGWASMGLSDASLYID
jgi:hypothetical protein